MTNISGIDLNLIVVFEAIYRTQNLSHAALEIGLTQPSVSAALKRLREITGDELFTRLSRGMAPTERAHNLYEKLAPAIELIKEGLTDPEEFDIKEYKKIYRIGIVDIFIYSVFPKLLKLAKKEAPHIKFLPMLFSQSEFSKQLRSGHYDFVLATTGYHDNIEGLYSRDLFADNYCIISRKNHPDLSRNLTMKQYLSQEHIMTSFEGKLSGFIDTILKEKGLSREVKLSVANFMTVPFIVESTNMLAGVSEKTAVAIQKNAKIDIHKVPFELPGLDNKLYWHNKFEHDPGKDWVLGAIERVVK